VPLPHPPLSLCTLLLLIPQPGSKSFFSEIIASVSDIRFSQDGRFILARDFMTLKLWDLRNETEPVASFAVHEQLRGQVGLEDLHHATGRFCSSVLTPC